MTTVCEKIATILSEIFDISARQCESMARYIEREANESNGAKPSLEDLLADNIGAEVARSEPGRLACFRIALALEMQERPIPPLQRRVPVSV